MDAFGIGDGVKGAVNVYFQSSRATGRTTQLLNSLRDGDRVICHSAKEAHRLSYLARERGLDVTFVCSDGLYPDLNHHTRGRTIFDHEWVHIRYLDAIKRVEMDIDELQRIHNRSHNEDNPVLAVAEENKMRWKL